MPPNDKKRSDCGVAEHSKLTSGDLQNILEVNKKAIEIHLEVEKQNEEIIEDLTHIKAKVDDIDKALFKLVMILGGLGASTIFGIIELILGHK
jgi:hypothetical protein